MKDTNHQEQQEDEEYDDRLVRQYWNVDHWCRQHIRNGSPFMFDPILFEQTMKHASEQLDFPLQSLNSFYRNIHTNKHVKAVTFKVRNNLESIHIPQYVKGDKTIKQIAQEANFPPYFMCRAITESIADLRGKGKKGLINAMRDPLNELGTLDVIRPQYIDTEINYQRTTQQQQQQQLYDKPKDGTDESSSASR
jgi:hypothetical protein